MLRKLNILLLMLGVTSQPITSWSQTAQTITSQSQTAQTDMEWFLGGEMKAVSLSETERDSVFAANKRPGEGAQKRYRLEYENKKSLYRHSFEADYYLVDTEKGNNRIPIGGGPVRDAFLSPNGKYVVYGKQNNLYIYKVDFKTEVAITTHNGERQYTDADGRQHTERHIFNGISDWMYEEEFGETRYFAFSPDSKQIAFLRLEESQVRRFEWQLWLDSAGRGTAYPTSDGLRYPKAGEQVPNATICVYDIYYKTTRTIPLGEVEGWYIPRITWGKPIPQGKNLMETPLFIERLNRDQNSVEVYAANTKSTTSTLIYREHSDKYYIDYSLFDSWQWLKNGSFVMLSEQEGWRSLYLCNARGKIERRLTPAGMDVTDVYGMDEGESIVYYQAAPTALTRQCYAVQIKNGRTTDLTYGDGIHRLYFSPEKRQVIEHYESLTEPGQWTLYDVRADKLTAREVIEDNAEVKTRWEQSGMQPKQLLRIPTERGDTLHAWIIMPVNFDSTKLYPAILMQYSGPGSQQVLNRWRKHFGHVLSAAGYVVINADPRGTNARGRAWRNATYMHLGTQEAQDQLSTARFAAALPYVDAQRIGMIGWSYGGYQTLRTMTEQNQSIICCGVAIAPVTDWRLYDAAYTERFMRRPQVNEAGYDEASLLNKADRLTGEVLIVHGLADDNVHAQNTLLYIDELVKADKQFQMQLYPDDNHFLRKRNNYKHLHERILRFFNEQLKPHMHQ